MAISRQTLDDLARLVEAYAARSNQITEQTIAAVLAAYAGKNFYDPGVVRQIAEQAAEVSNNANIVAAALVAQYLAIASGESTGTSIPLPNLTLPPIRNGVPLEEVFERPVKLFRRKVSDGMAPAEAFDQAMRLAQGLTTGNIALAKRDMSQVVMRYIEKAAGITGYRRVVHPELSETGSCGLCIAASDQIYSVGTLMPLHARCKCEPMPIFGDVDPGNSLNNLSLSVLYEDASRTTKRKSKTGGAPTGTSGELLKRTRYEVNEHGEWGPVLTHQGHKFTGPNEIAA